MHSKTLTDILGIFRNCVRVSKCTLDLSGAVISILGQNEHIQLFSFIIKYRLKPKKVTFEKKKIILLDISHMIYRRFDHNSLFT